MYIYKIPLMSLQFIPQKHVKENVLVFSRFFLTDF